MIKRVAAIFFILLANLIMLAHAVIPHHHHDEAEICIERSHCESDCGPHEHNAHEHDGHEHSHGHNHDDGTAMHNHENDHAHDYFCCTIKPTVILPSNHFQLECKSYSLINGPLDFDYTSSTQQYSGLNKAFAYTDFKDLIPRITSLYENVVGQSFGLRAPPVV